MSKDQNEIKALLKITVVRYFDCLKYWNDLADVDESFDESIVYFDTQTRLNRTNMPPKGNQLILNAISSLDKTIESFRLLKESAEKECKKLLGQVLKMEEAGRKEIFGNVLEYDKAMIDEIFMEIPELGYRYDSDEAFEMFLKFMNEKLA